MIIAQAPRILIRNIHSQDINELLKIYNTKDNMRFVSTGKYNWSEQELHDKYENTNKDYINGYGIYAIELKASSQIIGEAGLFNSFNDVNKLELGYILDAKFWKQGYGTEVCMAIIDYAFKTLKVKKLIARMYKDNSGSVKLSEKCGMKQSDRGTTKEGLEYLVYEISNDRKS